MAYDDLGLFKAKDSAYLKGVDVDLIRMSAALQRTFTIDDAAREKLSDKYNFGEVLVTDGQNHGLRNYESPHNHGKAIDLATFSVPDVPNITMKGMVPHRIKTGQTRKAKNGKRVPVYKTVMQPGDVTLTGNKAKEQFLADMATAISLDKFRASMHDVGFGMHIHVEHGDQSSVRKFNPAKSDLSAQNRQDAENRLKKAFKSWGMDGDAALKRMRDENGIGVMLSRIEQGARNTFGDIADMFNNQDPEAAKKNAEIVANLVSQAKFSTEGGDARFAGVHDWVANGKGNKPSSVEIAAYQALLASNKIDPGPIDGKMGEKTKAGATALQNQFPNLKSAQLAQAVLSGHSESPTAIADAEKREADKKLAAQVEASANIARDISFLKQLKAARTNNVAASSSAGYTTLQKQLGLPELDNRAIASTNQPAGSVAALPARMASEEAQKITGLPSLRARGDVDNAFVFGRVQQKMMGKRVAGESYATQENLQSVRAHMKSFVGEKDGENDRTLATRFSEKIATYQEKNNLPKDGILGKTTYEAGQKELAASKPEGGQASAAPPKRQQQSALPTPIPNAPALA